MSLLKTFFLFQMFFAMVLSLDTAMLFRINPNIDEAPCLFHMSLLFMQEPSTIHSIRKIFWVRILAAQSVLPALEVSSFFSFIFTFVSKGSFKISFKFFQATCDCFQFTQVHLIDYVIWLRDILYTDNLIIVNLRMY